MRGEPIKVNIFINGRRLEEIPEGELQQLKEQITDRAMSAAGYERASGRPRNS